MRVVEVLERAGGVLDSGRLVELTSRGRVRAAVRRGDVVRQAHGRYALPTAAEGVRAAHRLTGVLSGLSAAAHHGWELKTQPARPTVTVPRNRKVPPERRVGVDLLAFEPQVVISEGGFVGRPDLVDVRRRLVAEADSFEFHGHRRALRRDCRRYTALTLLGWRVLRFSWEDVMLDPAYVRRTLVSAATVPVDVQLPRPGA
jgi:hypothetical protein